MSKQKQENELMKNIDRRLSWTGKLKKPFRCGKLPTNAEELYSSLINFLISFWQTIPKEELGDDALEYEKERQKIALELRDFGYSEYRFRYLIQNSISGIFENPFVIGSILSNNGIEHQWSKSQKDWDAVLNEIKKLSLHEATNPALLHEDS
jgi:hypothetical protein|tara:strand:- start:68 stop:523 length:456 start_codon:yes stop_codon:yes gene_type:complete